MWENLKMDFGRPSDLEIFCRAVKNKNFRDDPNFSLKDQFVQTQPFRWFEVWKEATKKTSESRPFLDVANAAARRWWALEGAGFEGFGYDSVAHAVVISEKMREGMHRKFWRAFEEAGRMLGLKVRSCPDLAKRFMLMEAEYVHDSYYPDTEDEEAGKRGGFSPPQDWRAIVEAAMQAIAARKAAGKTNRAVQSPESGGASKAKKTYRCRYCSRSFETSQGVAGHIAGHIARNEPATRRNSAVPSKQAANGVAGPSGTGGGSPKAAPAADCPRGSGRKRGRPEMEPAADAPRGGSGRHGGAAAPAAARSARNHEHRPGMIAAAGVMVKELMPKIKLGTILREAYGLIAEDEVVDLGD